MLIPRLDNQFKRDVRKAGKRGKDMGKLRALLNLLLDEQPLPAHYHNHRLKGDWASYWDAHIEPDWLLIYRVKGDELQLARTGTHADIFDE
jgi:mRNA interferase YafQ